MKIDFRQEIKGANGEGIPSSNLPGSTETWTLGSLVYRFVCGVPADKKEQEPMLFWWGVQIHEQLKCTTDPVVPEMDLDPTEITLLIKKIDEAGLPVNLAHPAKMLLMPEDAQKEKYNYGKKREREKKEAAKAAAAEKEEPDNSE